MKEVFSLDDLPERRMTVRNLVALSEREQLGDAISIARQQLARMLAEKILEKGQVFSITGAQSGGHRTVEFRVDCIVLTADEFAALKQESFRQGVEHAQGFMPEPVRWGG